VLPVLGQQREREVLGEPVHPPRLRHRLEAAHEQATDLFAHVDPAVGVAEHGELARHPGHGLGDDVEMLGGVQRHVDARHPAQLASPHPRAVHHRVARDITVIGADARRRAVLPMDAGHGHVLDEGGAALARAFRQGQRGVDRIRPPVPRDPHGAGQVVGAHQRPEAAGVARRDHLDLDAEALGHRRATLQLDQPLLRPRDADAARAPESRGLSRLRFELLVEHGAVAREAGEVVAGAELADEARRMPRGAAGEVATLEEHDVAPPELRQVIRDAASDDPASDDDGARVRRNRAGHRRTIAHRK